MPNPNLVLLLGPNDHEPNWYEKLDVTDDRLLIKWINLPTSDLRTLEEYANSGVYIFHHAHSDINEDDLEAIIKILENAS